jgi:MFS transporter, DHA2 family, multidrug resistance protein
MSTTRKASARTWLGLALLALPCMITVMDLTVLNLAVPKLSEALKPSGVQLLWIIDIYGFMLAGSLITVGNLGDRVGRRKMLLIGGAAFGLASAAAAFSTSAWMLIATRALLGLAGAALAPSTLSLLRTMFEDDSERTQAIGIWGASFAVGAAVGPLVGGILLEHFWWGSVFLVGVPVMVVLLAVGPFVLPEYRDPHPGRIDLASAVLSIASVLAIVYGLKQFVQDGASVMPVVAVVAGLIGSIIFVRRQRRLVDPLVDLSLFKRPQFSVAVATNVLNVFTSFGTYILISQYLQLVLGLSPLQAGLLALPASLMAIAGPMLSPILVPRFGAAATVSLFLAIAGAGFGLTIFVEGPLAALIIGVSWALWAIGGSAAATITTGTILGSAPPERAGTVSALAQTGAELGGALGIAVLGSLGTAVYRGMIGAGLPAGIPSDLAAAARDTLAGALSVAAQVSDPVAAATLTFTAQDALTSALHVTSAIGLIISLGSAVAAAYYLRDRAPLATVEATCTASA